VKKLVGRAALALALLSGLAATSSGQDRSDEQAAAGGPVTLPNLSDRSKWPSPTADSATYAYALFDLIEYQRIRDVNAVRWDALAWIGGDTRRIWLKSEGQLYPSTQAGGEADVQALYGVLIAPFFDLQAGLRYEKHYERNNPSRVFAVVGLQGLAPYRFEIEPTLFVSNKGKVSGRFTAAYDVLLTQRLILQLRVETEFAFQKDEEFGVDSGFNDAEFGLRLRYEVRRELAPYAGLSYRESFGATRSRVLREGGAPNELQLVAGVRVWF
jgi:copper resistance protein B